MQEVIQKGLPDVGWEGDPYLELVFHHPSETWLVLDTLMTPPSVVLRKPAEGLRDLDFRSLCERLKAAQFKGQGVQSIVNRVEARNAAKEADANKIQRATHMEVAERLAWAMARDLH